MFISCKRLHKTAIDGKNTKILKYGNISGFLETKVEGHTGQFVYGHINNIPILCAQGRFHYYEGYTFDEVGIIIKLFNYYKPKPTVCYS